MTNIKDKLFTYIKKEYHKNPEYPWARYPGYAVFRHSDNQKWFALIMDIPKSKLQKRYDPNKFTFDILGKKYGIFAVRGPRGIPESLSEALK